MYDSNSITTEEANHILIFTHFANPVFILTTISVFLLQGKVFGWFLLTIHYLSNFILGIIFRGNNNYISERNNNKNSNNFSTIFILAIKRAIDTIITICGVLVVFLLLSSIIINTFNISGYNMMLVKGIFEITIGIEELGKLNLSSRYALIITSMFLAFGGISVHVQVLSQLTGTNIKYMYFFIGRMYQMIIAGILTYIGCIILGI